MKFTDNYVKHFIDEYRKSINLESNNLSTGLNAVLDYAIEVSNNREEFFEALSIGNYKLSINRNEEFSEDLYQEVKTSMDETLLHERARKSVDDILSAHKEVLDPFAILPEKEAKVITALYFNDSYMPTIANQIKESEDYVLTLTRSALTHMYMTYGTRLDTIGEENIIDILTGNGSSSKGRKK